MSINVPIIIIPVNDNTENCLKLDLGNLAVDSDYYIGKPNKSTDVELSDSAPIRQISVELNNMNISII